jgi:hypothetical protein
MACVPPPKVVGTTFGLARRLSHGPGVAVRHPLPHLEWLAGHSRTEGWQRATLKGGAGNL